MNNPSVDWTSIQEGTEVFQTRFVGFACFTILSFDHIITFADEVEYIWKGRKSPLVLLFLINRYITPLGFIVNLLAYTSPIWTQERCQHFVRYEGAMVAIGLEIAGFMMLLRIYALYYSSDHWPIVLVASILTFEIAMNAWLLTHGRPVPRHNLSIQGCSMIFDPKLSGIASASAWIPLLYDTVVLSLTVYKALPARIESKRIGASLLQRMLADGILYYSVMFLVNIALTLMIILAPPGTKNITAQLELVMTVTIISRMTLSLRKAVRKSPIADESFSLPAMPPLRHCPALVPEHPIRIIDITNNGIGKTGDEDLEPEDSPLDVAVEPTASRKGAWYDV